MRNFLVVGAGFSGAVYARQLAENGNYVTIIDKRNHIAGNAYDFINEEGVRVHKYGPHLFHTNNNNVVKWLSRFTDWVDYKHKVKALLPNGFLTPLPISLRTINDVYSTNFSSPEEGYGFLEELSENIAQINSAEDFLFSTIGKDLTNLFFRPYTKKMWGLDLQDMEAKIVKRLKIKLESDELYFPDDKFQALPKHGYQTLISNMLDHKNIKVNLSTNFDKKMEKQFHHCFYSGAIDEYFDYKYGYLPYRSIRFHEHKKEVSDTVSVVNYTDEGIFTRETIWENFPNSKRSKMNLTNVTIEEPCDYKENNFERYYPIKDLTGKSQTIYNKYLKLSEKYKNISFFGRCGGYVYLDMDQVVNQSLIKVAKFIKSA